MWKAFRFLMGVLGIVAAVVSWKYLAFQVYQGPFMMILDKAVSVIFWSCTGVLVIEIGKRWGWPASVLTVLGTIVAVVILGGNAIFALLIIAPFVMPVALLLSALVPYPKLCPRCKKRINRKATRCPYCQSDFSLVVPELHS